MDNKTQNSNNFIAYIVATAPALFQLIAVVSVGLNEKLNLRDFVFNPEFLNIANLFVILFTIILITLNSWWDTNKFSLTDNSDQLIFPFTKLTKTFWQNIKNVTFFSLFFGLIFISISLNKNFIPSNVNFWATLQWVSYISTLTLTSYGIYILILLKMQEITNKTREENFIPKLMDSLRRYGFVNNPDVKILSVNKYALEAYVLIENVKWKVATNQDGEISSIIEYNETPSETY